MEPTRLRCTVQALGSGSANEPSRRVGPSGLLIGRQRDCDIVATDPAVSRRHALVRLTSHGAEVVPLGNGPVEINGEATAVARSLGNGDQLRVPGLALTVTIEIAAPSSRAASTYVLERGGATGSFGVVHSPFVIGGGDSDDLIVRTWPPATLQLHLAQGMLYVELRDGRATREQRVESGERFDQSELEVGTLEPLLPGDRLTCRGEAFTITMADHRATTTAAGGSGDLPAHVAIEFLPRGGRLVFTVGGRPYPVYLADRRFDLLVALLRPPAEYRAGELIPDDIVRAIVWPRKLSVSRPEINMLISRCRRDLVDAGLAGPRLIERAQGGGATRVLLATAAVVEVIE